LQKANLNVEGKQQIFISDINIVNLRTSFNRGPNSLRKPVNFRSQWYTNRTGNLGDLATVSDEDFLAGLAGLRSKRLDLLDDIHSLCDLSKDHMLPIQPLGLGSAEEKLAAVGVRAGVCHGEDSWSSVLQLKVLIRELVSVDGLSTSSIVVGKVSSLAHEVGDDTMEGRSLESESLLTSAESTEVLAGLRHNVIPQLHDHLSDRGSISSNVEKNLAGHFGISSD